MKRSLRCLCLVLALALCLGLAAPARGLSDKTLLRNAANGAARWLLNAVPAPGAGGFGADFAVISVARSGYNAEESWYRSYLSYMESELRAHDGALNTRRYSDYAKAVIAYTALGQTPPPELLRPLSNYEAVLKQGINGPSWALMALDCGNYALLPDSSAKVAATRQMYVDEILSRQLSDGGWTLSGKGGGPGPSDPDITAMMLQALAPYQEQEAVRQAVDRALDCISAQQKEDGSLASYGVTCSESPAQMILALCALGLSPEDERFVKPGGSLVDSVLRYRQPDGRFLHTLDGTDADILTSTEQCLEALTAVLRYQAGQPSLFRITDPLKLSAEGGLPGKDYAVMVMPFIQYSVSFKDLAGKDCRSAVIGLAQRNILNGYEDRTFLPDGLMTRAEFAKLAVTALGIRAAGMASFPDVAESAWYYGPVAAAARYGIVNGRDTGEFDPRGNINLQEAAAMVCRSAALCGLDTALSAPAADRELSGYGDRSAVQSWAKPTLAWCLKNGVVVRTDRLEPLEAVTRGEIAQMFWRLLELAELR